MRRVREREHARCEVVANTPLQWIKCLRRGPHRACVRYGRRFGFVCGSSLVLCGIALIALAPVPPPTTEDHPPTVWMLIAGRVLAGIGIGGPGVALPMLVAEIAPSRMRGSVFISMTFVGSLGSLSLFVANFLAPGWRTIARIATGITLLVTLGGLTLLESPRWLLRRHGTSSPSSPRPILPSSAALARACLQ